MKLRILVVVLFVAAGAARGQTEKLTVALTAGTPAEVNFDSAVDDRNYEDPRGYAHHGSATRTFQRRLTLTNNGRVPLSGPLLIVNGENWSRVEALPVSFPPTARSLMPRLFDFWRERITHADSDAPGGKEPLALLNFWGYALCGDTTAALARLAAASGVAARKIPLNGHVAAEYFFDGAWRILDADQNVCYLRLDNRTLASAADLRADPFLALRTKPLGRYATMEHAAAAFNTALHEFVAPAEEKTIKAKAPPAPVRADILFPGETMILHCDRAPEIPVGRTDLGRWGSVRQDALRVVEFAIQPAARKTATPGEALFTSGYPILRAVNHSTGETFATPPAQPTFELRVKYRAPGDKISVYGQRSNVSLPRLRRGRNTISLGTHNPEGGAQLLVEWERAAADLVIPSATVTLLDGAPTFRVQSEPAGDLLWWQVSATEDFAFVPPNFDAILPATQRVSLDALTATFFNPGEPYYFRARTRHAGVWGDWSTPLTFRVDKPAALRRCRRKSSEPGCD